MMNAKKVPGMGGPEPQGSAADRKRSQTDRSKLAAAAEAQIHKKADPMRLSMEKPLPKAPVAPANESIANLAQQDPVPVAAASSKKDYGQLEPIENYKGKSLEELEAILDAHNAAQA